MEEKTLLKLSFIVSLVGIAALFFVSQGIEADEKPLGKITLTDLDSHVKLKGAVSTVVNTGNAAIITIQQPQEIKVVMFQQGNITLRKGSEIEVIGEVQEYNGKPEIVGQKIRIIG